MRGGPVLEDEQGVRQAQAGSKEAFAALIRQYELAMYRVARGMLRSDEDAADAIQDAVVSAYQSLHQLREPRFFRTWLIRILINQCKAMLRRQSRTVYLDTLPEAVAPHVSIDESLDMEASINRLHVEHKEVIVLFYFADWSLKEIADALQVSEGTVKSRLNRARAKLASMRGPASKGEDRR